MGTISSRRLPPGYLLLGSKTLYFRYVEINLLETMTARDFIFDCRQKYLYGFIIVYGALYQYQNEIWQIASTFRNALD